MTKGARIHLEVRHSSSVERFGRRVPVAAGFRAIADERGRRRGGDGGLLPYIYLQADMIFCSACERHPHQRQGCHPRAGARSICRRWWSSGPPVVLRTPPVTCLTGGASAASRDATKSKPTARIPGKRRVPYPRARMLQGWRDYPLVAWKLFWCRDFGFRGNPSPLIAPQPRTPGPFRR